jgi:anti-anti-sigma factor
MSATHVVHLEGEVTIYRAAELKDAVLAPLATAANRIEIDLSQVSAIDTVGVQLLMLARREALAAGRELRLSGHSAVVTDTFELLDLHAYFGDAAIPSTSAA